MVKYFVGSFGQKYGNYDPYKIFSKEEYGKVKNFFRSFTRYMLLNRSDEGCSKYGEMSLLNLALTVHQLFKFNGVGAIIIVHRYIILSRFFEKRYAMT